MNIFKVSYTVFKQAAQIYQIYYYGIPNGYILGTGSKDSIFIANIHRANEISDFNSTLKSSSIATEREGDVYALPAISVDDSHNIKRFDTSGTDFIYIGSAQSGVSTSSIGWTIKRFELDVNGEVVEKRVTTQNSAVWDNRSSETYI